MQQAKKSYTKNIFQSHNNPVRIKLKEDYIRSTRLYYSNNKNTWSSWVGSLQSKM